jgi:HSP20 family protein
MSARRPRLTNPLDDVGLVEAFFYGSPSPRTVWPSTVWMPPTDVYETEDEVVIQVEIAGVPQSDLSVSLYNRRLVIQGTRVDRGPMRRAYHQMEIHFGDFRAEVDLPAGLDETRVDAEYSDGFLRVVLPKVKPRYIDVQE